MSRRWIVLGIAVLMIATGFAVVSAAPSVGSLARSTSPVAPAVTPAIPVIDVLPVNLFGTPTFKFIPGDSTTGRIYFRVTDPADDAAVTVHINDVNATRDGLTNPVASWVVNVSTGSYDSTLTGLAYTLPTLTYGGNWNITASGTVGGNESTGFVVETYDLSTVSPDVVLAGTAGYISFLVTGEPSGSAYSAISNVTITAIYFDLTVGTYRSLPLAHATFGAGVSSGTVSYVLPVNASEPGFVYFSVWANVTSNGLYSEFRNVSTAIGSFDFVRTTTYLDCSCIGDFVIPNSQVTVVAIPYMLSEEGRQQIPGVTITYSFWAGTTSVPAASIPGSPPTSVTTGAGGFAEISFLASPAVFSTTVYNQVNVSFLAVPSVDGSAPVYDNLTDDFYLAATGTSMVAVTATFSQGTYFGGEAGTIAWSLVPPSGGTTNGWSGLAYSLTTSPVDAPSSLVAYALISGSSGSIAFTAPANYTGYLYLLIAAHNASYTVIDEIDVEILQAVIVLTPSETAFNPGDTVVITVTTEGLDAATTTLFETTTNGEGGLFSAGIVTGGSFALHIPNVTAPVELDVEVTAQTSTNGVVGESSVELYENAGLVLNVGISTLSKYSDGSFQPGETITVTWSQSTYGPGSLGSSYAVTLWTANGWYGDQAPVAVVVTSATSGSFQYTIPSNSGAGQQSLFVQSSSYTDCVNYCYAVNQVSYSVNPNPSVLSYELGAGSGLTVGWLILLLVIIVVALLIVLMIRRGRGPKSPPSSYQASEPMTPPAPAPSTAPATEWKDSPPPAAPAPASGEGDAPPPLPAPPESQ